MPEFETSAQAQHVTQHRRTKGKIPTMKCCFVRGRNSRSTTSDIQTAVNVIFNDTLKLAKIFSALHLQDLDKAHAE